MAEVLQVNLDEKRLILYANALADLGSAGLEMAMAQLLADPDIRPGHMLLPGKIRELAGGRIADKAQQLVTEILTAVQRTGNRYGWKDMMSLEAWEIANAYGLRALEECSPDQRPTIVAQLRDMARAACAARHRETASVSALTYGGGKNLAIAGILESPTITRGKLEAHRITASEVLTANGLPTEEMKRSARFILRPDLNPSKEWEDTRKKEATDPRCVGAECQELPVQQPNGSDYL